MHERGFHLVDDFEEINEAALYQTIKDLRYIFQLFSVRQTGRRLMEVEVRNKQGLSEKIVLNDDYEDPATRAHIHAYIIPMLGRLVAACDKQGKGALVREVFADVAELIPALHQSSEAPSSMGQIIQVNFRRA